MAQIVKRVGKNGKISYLIRVSSGYGIDGKQRKKSMTWTPPEGMTHKKIEKQLQIEAIKFEESVNSGILQDNTIRFQSFAEKWLNEYAKKQLKIKTWTEYEKRFDTINQAIGHIKLKDLKTGHLNTFYANLQEEGIRKDTKFKAAVDLRALMKKKKITGTEITSSFDISAQAIRSALNGSSVNESTAIAISKALNMPRSDLFEEHSKGATLNANTVRGYHRLISSILSKAVKWGYIPFNPAINAELPKLRAAEAVHLDESDARKLLTMLQGEPIKYRAPITFDLLSGLRRGELLGLRWTDVNFNSETITIVQTSGYIAGSGIYVDTPKNKTSSRPLKLSRTAFIILEEYRAWQDKQRELCGDRWKDKDKRIFTNDEGAPIHPDTLTKWFTDFAKQCGFSGVHLHSLRHTYASLMISEGTPLVVVSRRLGHAQVSTTANIYSHVIASADEKVAQITEKFSDLVLFSDNKADGTTA